MITTKRLTTESLLPQVVNTSVTHWSDAAQVSSDEVTLGWNIITYSVLWQMWKRGLRRGCPPVGSEVRFLNLMNQDCQRSCLPWRVPLVLMLKTDIYVPPKNAINQFWSAEMDHQWIWESIQIWVTLTTTTKWNLGHFIALVWTKAKRCKSSSSLWLREKIRPAIIQRKCSVWPELFP